MLENKIYEGIYYSQFVVSWVKSGGKINNYFKEWLRSLVINGEKIPEEIVREIHNFADNGKLELQESAKNIINADTERKMNLLGSLKAQEKIIEKSECYAHRAIKKRDRGMNCDVEVKVGEELILIAYQLLDDLVNYL